MKFRAILMLLVLVVSFFASFYVVGRSYSALAPDDPSWYTEVDGAGVKLGFSKFGEFIDNNTNVGLEYAGARDPWAPLAGMSLDNTKLPKNVWINGWYIDITYNHSVWGLRNVWAGAMFADLIGYAGPWLHVSQELSGGSYPESQESFSKPGNEIAPNGTVIGTSPVDGGRKTNGTAVTDPIQVVYNGPAKFVACLTTHLYDYHEETNETLHLVDVVFVIVFDKAVEEVMVLKYVQLACQAKSQLGQLPIRVQTNPATSDTLITSGMVVQFSDREGWDLGTNQTTSPPTVTYSSYAHFYTQGTGPMWGSPENDTLAEGQPAECNALWTALPTIPANTSIVGGWQNTSAYGPAPTAVHANDTYDVAQIISNDKKYVAFAGYWPSLSDWSIDAGRRTINPSTVSAYGLASGRKLCNAPILGNESHDIDSYTNPNDEPFLSPLTVGEWDFCLSGTHSEQTGPNTGLTVVSDSQFIGASAYGVTDLHDASDANFLPGYPNTYPNVIDREVRYQLNRNFETSLILSSVSPLGRYLTVNAEPSSIATVPAVSIIPPYTVDQYNNVSLEALQVIPVSTDTHYRFDHWSVDNVTVNGNPITINVDANHTATAHYALITPTAGATTVYINSDGSVTPCGAPISSSDNVTYTLTGNASWPTYYGIVVNRSNIILNGAGYTVLGNATGAGVNVTSINNVTIKNINVNNFLHGIYVSYSVNDVVSKSNFTSNGEGVDIEYSDNDTVSGDNASANTRYGIYVYSSSNITISLNNASANRDRGIYLYQSNNSTVSGDIASANSNFGISVYSASNDTVSGNDARSNSIGIMFDSSPNNTISLNNASANAEFGIWVWSSSNNTVSGNNVSSNPYYGMFLYSSSNNTVSGNDASANAQYGIYLHQSSNNNKIADNNATSNSNTGIYVDSSINNTVTGNSVRSNNFYGIALNSSSSNNITANTLANNNIGLTLQAASNNSIYHNNFVGNTAHTSVNAASLRDAWNDSYPSGGNYWDDYIGVDVKSGPNQNLPGSDGIGDTPDVIDANNQDHYPLMTAWIEAHDVAVTNVTTCKDGGKPKTVVCQGYNCNITVTVQNQGSFTETFNVTAYANTTATQTKTLTLTSGSSTTLDFTWNTAGFAKGNYTISAYAWPVQSETDTADNNFAGGRIVVSMVGDLTGGTPNVWDFVPDGKCSSADVSVVSRCFGSSPQTAPPLRWEPNCDLNNNGHVDGNDVAYVARHFGESDP